MPVQLTLTHPNHFQRSKKRPRTPKPLLESNWLLIFHALTHASLRLAEITALVDLDKATVARHLIVLRQDNIIVDERRGPKVFYTLRQTCLIQLFKWLEEFQAQTKSRPRLQSLSRVR